MKVAEHFYCTPIKGMYRYWIYTGHHESALEFKSLFPSPGTAVKIAIHPTSIPVRYYDFATGMLQVLGVIWA